MKLCPKCGKENHCAIENQKNHHTCWCMKIKVKDSVKSLISEKYKNQGCLCQTCLEDEIKNNNSFINEKSKTD
jgi:hypothetical protein